LLRPDNRCARILRETTHHRKEAEMPHTLFDEAHDLLQEAASGIRSPSGQGLDAPLEYAQAAASIGIGLAILALVNKLPQPTG
jgi:hypothetical protein